MSDQWYYGQNGVQKGPVSVEVIRQLISGGHLKPDDLVWREGMANWAPASTMSELFAPTVPAPQPQPQPVVPPQAARVDPVPPAPAAPLGYQSMDPQVAASLQSRATTALVMGICSIVPGACCAPLGLGLGIAAVLMGKNAEIGPGAGAAKAGFVCGIIGIVLSVLSCLPQMTYYTH